MAVWVFQSPGGWLGEQLLVDGPHRYSQFGLVCNKRSRHLQRYGPPLGAGARRSRLCHYGFGIDTSTVGLYIGASLAQADCLAGAVK